MKTSYQTPEAVAEYIVKRITGEEEFHVLNPTSAAVEAQFERVYVDPTGDILYKLLTGDNSIAQNLSQSNLYETQPNKEDEEINPSKNKLNETKKVLITDIDCDAGKATAEKFIAAGYKVYGLTENRKVLKNVSEQVDAIELNILNTSESDLKKFIKSIEPIDVLINNPATGKPPEKTLEKLSEDDIDKIAKIIEDKIINIVKITDAVLPGMQDKERKTGTILTFSSASAKVPIPLPKTPTVDSFVELALNAFLDNIMDVSRYYLKNRFNIKVANIHPDAHSTADEIATTILKVEAQKDPDFFTPISNTMKKLFGVIYKVLGKDYILTLPKEESNENTLSNAASEQRHALVI